MDIEFGLSEIVQGALAAGLAFTVWQQRIMQGMILRNEARLDNCLEEIIARETELENPPAIGPPG